MGSFIFFAFAAGVAVLVVLAANQDARAVDAAWTEAAKKLGLTFEPRGWGGARKLEGQVRGCAVDVHEDARGKGVRTYFRVSRRGVPPDLAIKAEGDAAAFKKIFTGDDTQLLDQRFDDLVHVTGPEDAVLATLNQPARKALCLLLSRETKAKLAQGTFEVVKQSRIRQGVEISRRVEELAEVARLLRVKSVPEALAANARGDGVAATRRRNLEVLARDHAGSPCVATAAEAALSDTDSLVRLVAARVVGGDRERAVVGELLGRLISPPQDVRIAALRRLVEIAPYDEVRPHVARMLQARAPEEQRAALAAAAKGRDVSAVEPIGALTASTDLDVAKAAAEALGAICDPRGQAPLLRMLCLEPPPVEAVVALGKLGTVEAVEPLLPLSKALLPGALRDAAQVAVWRIQSRLGEADAGRLSVVESDPGAAAGLSLVERVEEGAPVGGPEAGVREKA